MRLFEWLEKYDRKQIHIKEEENVQKQVSIKTLELIIEELKGGGNKGEEPKLDKQG